MVTPCVLHGVAMMWPCCGHDGSCPQWFRHGVSMTRVMVAPSWLQGLAKNAPCRHHGATMVTPWSHHGDFMVTPSMVSTRCRHDGSSFPWSRRGPAMVYLWCLHHLSMACPSAQSERAMVTPTVCGRDGSSPPCLSHGHAMNAPCRLQVTP